MNEPIEKISGKLKSVNEIELLNALDNIDGIVSCGQIARIALCNGQIAVYNRFRSVFSDWIYEHNEKYAKGYKADLKLCSRDFEEIC